MTGCPNNLDDAFRCPTKEEYARQILALLPRGRAWQSHQELASTDIERFPDTNAEAADGETGAAQAGQPALVATRTVMAAYWASWAEVLAFFARRACELLNEFFCQSVNETSDLWGADFGFPDPCDPWNDLCEKVAALGGSTCAYLVWAAARRGWQIDCRDCGGIERTRAGCASAGCARVCRCALPNTVFIRINLTESESFEDFDLRAKAGGPRAGCARLCGPDTSLLQCLIERVKPAHVEAIYEVV